ncbi:MAG: TolC family protein, partial [Hyphomonas sp.]|nr:TolC family protein [Hyphomonas sp.]
MTRISLLPLSLLVVAAGCANTQSSEMLGSSVTLPGAYETSVEADPALPDTALWWSSFGDNSLDGLVDRALQQNKSLEAGLANVISARAALRVAESNALPYVLAGANVSTDSESDFSDFSRSARLSASYQLDLFGSVAASREA